MHRSEDTKKTCTTKYLVSWLQILSCEYSYNIKAWCSFCLPPVGPPLPGRFVHFWVPLQAQYSIHTHTHTHTQRRYSAIVALGFLSFSCKTIYACRCMHGECNNVISARFLFLFLFFGWLDSANRIWKGGSSTQSMNSSATVCKNFFKKINKYSITKKSTAFRITFKSKTGCLNA